MQHSFQVYNGYLRTMLNITRTSAGAPLKVIRDRYMNYILAAQNISASTHAGWLGPDVPRHENLKQHNPPAHNYWSKYLALEAIESYAEAAAPDIAKKVHAALIAHQRQFYAQLTANDPPLNYSRWGFARYSDGIVGIQWLLDHGAGTSQDTAFLWDLMRELRTRADKIMSAADHSVRFLSLSLSLSLSNPTLELRLLLQIVGWRG